MNYVEIIKYALKVRKIKVKKWVDSDGGGWAFMETREVILPRAKTILGFARCWHEIGHFEFNHLNKKYRYIEEYEAEVFAISKLKEYGLDTRKYTRQAKLYVMHQLVKAFKRGHKKERIPKEIIKWYGKSFNKYKKSAEKTIFFSESKEI